MQTRVGLEGMLVQGGCSSRWARDLDCGTVEVESTGRPEAADTPKSEAAAATLNLRSSRKSDRLLVAGCCGVVGSAHSRCDCGATQVEAGGSDSDVGTAKLRGTGTETEHGGAESWSHKGTTTWTVTASTVELAATASARRASLYRLRGGHGQSVGFGRDRSREGGVGTGGWRLKVTQRNERNSRPSSGRSVSQGCPRRDGEPQRIGMVNDG